MASSTVSSEFTVGGKYRLVRKISSGSFGDIYLGVNLTNGEVKRIFMYNTNDTKTKYIRYLLVSLHFNVVCFC